MIVSAEIQSLIGSSSLCFLNFQPLTEPRGRAGADAAVFLLRGKRELMGGLARGCGFFEISVVLISCVTHVSSSAPHRYPLLGHLLVSPRGHLALASPTSSPGMGPLTG